ncbi:MazG nucleotide pyrophosphohydrolase domain-containing protein [Salinibacillus xinjiangensis]|uniref:NTP pyrophosphohydrolase MazG-like domain-containing protein n=1 Tax=Salinibacillus xinjiangensis TaxID=1229268 RepID=A0A6G1X803_9BACI|nr:MazG nucleotide pyrophosphohydrolase domain-containing protein [Salinibacillus xinjiangensis]MRG87133.1 hypothetical protein [Salinibacillus xinjiangensis]
MKEMQKYAKQLVKDMNWEIDDANFESSRTSLLNNYMLLTTEVGEVAEELRRLFNITYQEMKNGTNEQEAFRHGVETVQKDLGKEMVDCLAYLMKMANFFEIDLEEAYYEKMAEVKKRENKDVGVIKK